LIEYLAVSSKIRRATAKYVSGRAIMLHPPPRIQLPHAGIRRKAGRT
jgi:hypothetical protein